MKKTISIPKELDELLSKVYFNVSAVCSRALEEEAKKWIAMGCEDLNDPERMAKVITRLRKTKLKGKA